MGNDLLFARAEYAARNFRLAIQFSEYALARESNHFEALELLGVSLLAAGKLRQGVAAIEEAALLRPLAQTTRIELAIAYGALGRTELSADLLMGIATGDDVPADGLLRIAAGLEAVDQPRLAMEACRQAGVRSPDLAEIHYQMSFYAQRCGHPHGTVEALLRHAVNLEPRNLHYRIGLASLLIRLERKAEAKMLLDVVVPDQLHKVTCTCCLKRIANLYFDFNERERSRLCTQRLKVLTKQTTSPKSGASVDEGASS